MIFALGLWLLATLGVITLAIWASRRLGNTLLDVLHALLVVAANVTVYKTFTLGGLIFTGGDLTYNSAYSLLDVIHRREGYGGARRLVWITALANLAAALFFWTAAQIPSGPQDVLGRAYTTLFSLDLRVVSASVLSFFVSSRVDVWVAHKIGIERRFILAFLGSNLASAIVDTLVFNTLAFFGVLSLLPLFGGQFLIKMLVSASNFAFILYARWLDARLSPRTGSP